MTNLALAVLIRRLPAALLLAGMLSTLPMARAATLTLSTEEGGIWQFSSGLSATVQLDGDMVSWGDVSSNILYIGVEVSYSGIAGFDSYSGTVQEAYGHYADGVMMGFSMRGFDGAPDDTVFDTLDVEGRFAEIVMLAQSPEDFAPNDAANPTLTATGTAVPEPAAGLLLLAVGGAAAWRRRALRR